MTFIRHRPGQDTNHSPDEMRDRQLDGIKQLAERFIFDLGLLMAGHVSPIEEYLAAPAAGRLRSSLEPFLAAGDAMRPNFGEYGELRVQGDLLAPDHSITAQVDFDDQSVRERADGELQPSRRRRMRLTLVIDPGLASIADFSLQQLAR